MPHVYIPAMMRTLTNGAEQVEVAGETVRKVVAALEAEYPGIRERLCDGDHLKPGIAVAVDGHMSSRGLRHTLSADSEVHFLPAIGGG